MRHTVRPLSDRTWLRPAGTRVRSRFDSDWTDTVELLHREVDQLDGRDLVIEVDVREQDIRLDGMLRANARADSPAVVVAFESRHGPMLYRCDRYNGRSGLANTTAWQDNVRAVAKTLEALRAVDRYGATETGEQYTGFKALPGGAPEEEPMTTDMAWSILGSFGPKMVADLRSTASYDELAQLHRKARRFAHPDRHDGSRELWDQVEDAARTLGMLR